MITLLYLLLISIGILILVPRLKISLKRLPPGPSFLTRLLESRSKELFAVKLMRWSKEYGSVMSIMDLVQFGKPTIVLGSSQAAVELLEKRGNIYSSRPRNIIAGEICFRGSKGSLLQTGTKLRRFRTIMSTTLGTNASKSFRPLENMEAKLMLRDLLLEPDYKKYKRHVQRVIHSVAFCASFGQRVDRLGSNQVKFYDNLDRFFVHLPGSHLVDHFPILLQLPTPLQWFRKEADKEGNTEERFYMTAMDRTKTAINKGLSLLGTGSRILERQHKYCFDDLELALLAGAPYAAGVSTTLGTFEAFALAAVLFPQAMKKAQEELDSVIGIHRLPDFEDASSLPYLRAVIKEILRWHPFAPVGLPHAVTEDDVYDGMFIPAGSTVIANIYAMTRNSELFPDPEEFKPERFLDDEDPSLRNYNITFGFGRRVCPGQYVAVDQLFSLISKILWAFDFVALEDSSNPAGRQYLHGRFGPPASLPYKLVPRGDHVAAVIMEQGHLAEKEAKAWESFNID